MSPPPARARPHPACWMVNQVEELEVSPVFLSMRLKASHPAEGMLLGNLSEYDMGTVRRRVA